MAELNERRQVYYIPDNYMEDGRILQGAIKVKNLIEGALLAAPFIFLGIGLGNELKMKIVLALVFGGPILCFGIIGYNGDALFTVVKSFKNWKQNKCLKVYNPKPTPFYVSPTDKIFATELAKDKVVAAIEDRQTRIMEEHMNQQLIEGETFEFAADPTVEKYHDESQKPKQAYAPPPKPVVVFDDDDDDIDDLFGFGYESGRRQQKTLDISDDDII